MNLANILVATVFLLGVPSSAKATRERYSLEAYELSSLTLRSVYFKGLGKPYALVRDPNGYLHRVFKGDYVGKNFGWVVAITRRGIKLKEVYQSQDGEWEERTAWLLKPDDSAWTPSKQTPDTR